MSLGQDITGLINRWTSGDAVAGEALMPLIYEELRRQAAFIFRRENPGHTLQPTALVHEVYAKLIHVDISWRDRTHFYALAARMMKRLLINHANSRKAEKRGGDLLRVTLGDAQNESADDILMFDLADALEGLSRLDGRKAELIELRYFGGLTIEEIEEVTALSAATIGRELRFATAWLKAELAHEER